MNVKEAELKMIESSNLSWYNEYELYWKDTVGGNKYSDTSSTPQMINII